MLPKRENIGRWIRRIVGDTNGATSIEYGLLASLIAIVAMQAMGAVGTQLGTTFETVSINMGGADEAPPPAADEPPPPANSGLP